VFSQKYPEMQFYKVVPEKYLFGKNSKTEVIKVITENPNHVAIGWIHYIALTTESFRGNEYDGYLVPFVGQCTKHVKGVIINGKTHMISNQDDIYFKQKLKLDMGYNRVPIKIITDDGSILNGNEYV